MSTIKVTNVQDTSGGNSSTSAEIFSGRAKVWVEFSGQSSATAITSFGVSSVVRTSNGNYTVNFSSNFANTDYAVFATSGVNNDTWDDGNQDADNIALVLNKFADKVYIGCGDLDDGDNDDQDRISVVIFA